jgi:hypothetical protein
VRAARLAGPRPGDQRPDPPVRQVVGDLLLRARHGRASRLPSDGPGRGGAGAVGDHHRRVLPAGPGPGHEDRAGPHAARRRRGYRYAEQPDRTAAVLRSLSWFLHDRAGPVRRRPEADRDRFAGLDQNGPGPGPRHGHGITGPGPRPAGPQMDQARMIARRLGATGKPVSRRALRSGGVTGSNEALNGPDAHAQRRDGRVCRQRVNHPSSTVAVSR